MGVGSLGDVSPHITLAKELKARGHHTTVVGLAPYASYAESLGVAYSPIPADTRALWPTARPLRALALAQPGFMLATMLRHFARSAPLVNDALVGTVRPGDVIITGIVTSGAAQLLGQEVGARCVPVLFAPLLPSQSADSSALAPGVGGPRAAQIGSTIMWRLSEALASAHTRDMAKRMGTRPIRPVSSGPLLMATSPTLCPASTSWPARLQQTGSIAPDTSEADILAADLRAFLDDGPAPLLMTFGSCPVVSAARDAEMFLAAARATGSRVIIQSDAMPVGAINGWAWNAPGVAHAALLPKTSGVVHHGGAGTTHAALAAGRPSLVIPHLGDQGYYARRVHALGAGPRGVPRWRLTSSILRARVEMMTTGAPTAGFAEAAAAVAARLATENGRETTANAVEALSFT